MSDAIDESELPSGEELEQAIEQARSGALSAEGFAAALAAATLLLAVVETTDADGQEAAVPLVIADEGIDYGVAFTSAAQWGSASEQTPFMLLDGAGLAQQWPPGLGLAINPESSGSLLLSPENLREIWADAGLGPQTVPAGTSIRVGAPDPGLPPQALETLRTAVQADATVQAAYELALAVGDGPIELVVGVEAAPPNQGVAQSFSATISEIDPGFVGMAFVDLDGSLLELAREASPPLA